METPPPAPMENPLPAPRGPLAETGKPHIKNIPQNFPIRFHEFLLDQTVPKTEFPYIHKERNHYERTNTISNFIPPPVRLPDLPPAGGAAGLLRLHAAGSDRQILIRKGPGCPTATLWKRCWLPPLTGTAKRRLPLLPPKTIRLTGFPCCLPR